MMVISHAHLSVILISSVAVDRIKEAHKVAVLEDKRREKGTQCLSELCALRHRLIPP
jgi:hypothetical protein